MLSFVLAVSSFVAQGTTQTIPMPNPYGPGQHVGSNTTHQRASRIGNRQGRRGRGIGGGFVGGGFIGGGLIDGDCGVREVIVESPPVKQDPLKDLVISPVYQRDNHAPKLIQIP